MLTGSWVVQSISVQRRFENDGRVGAALRTFSNNDVQGSTQRRRKEDFSYVEALERTCSKAELMVRPTRTERIISPPSHLETWKTSSGLNQTAC